MQAYLTKRLPPSLVDVVLGSCAGADQPAQKARQFCAHYRLNASAVDHFGVPELVQAPELWLLSHAEGQRRAEWLREVYPTHIQREIVTDSVLQCGKCKKHSVDYYEKQTRGADEPMTLFAHCLHCGNRWRQ